MSGKVFSSGIAQFDASVTGISAGDVVSLFVSRTLLWDEFTATFISESRERKIPIVHLCARPPKGNVPPGRKEYTFTIPDGKINFKSTSAAINRFLGSKGKGALVVVEELSLWRERLGGEKKLVEFVTELGTVSRKKGSLLLLGALRGALHLDTLAAVKDQATLAFDLIEQRSELILIPLALQGRYAPFQALPLRLKTLHRSRQLPPVEAVSAPDVPGTHQEPTGAIGRFFLDEHYKDMFLNAGEAMVIFNVRGDYREPNLKAISIFGGSATELLQKNVTTWFAPSEKRALLRCLVELRQKKTVSRTFTIERGGKKGIPVECYASPVGGDYNVAILHDVGDRLEREKEGLRRSEEMLTLLEEHPDGIAVISQQNLLYANPRFLRLFGYNDGGDALALRLKELFTAESWRKIQKAGMEKTGPGSPLLEVWCVKKDASTFVASVGITPLVFRRKQCLELSFTDTSQQKKLLDSIAESESRYRSVVETSVLPLAVLRDGVVELCNRATADLFGLGDPSEMRGKEISNFVGEASRGVLEECISPKGGIRKGRALKTVTGVRNGGTWFDLEIAAAISPVSGLIVAAFRDVSGNVLVEKEAATRRNEVDKIRQINNALDISLDRKTLFQNCTDILVTTLGWEFGAIFVAHPEKNVLSLTYDRHAGEAFKEKFDSLPLDEGMGGYLAKTREPIFIHTGKYPSHLPHRKIFLDLGLRSLLIIPLIARGEFTGMIILGSKKDKDAASHSVDLLGAIATEIGTAIVNASVFTEIERLSSERGALIDAISPIAYISAPNGHISYVGKGIERISGYPMKDFYRDPNLWLKLVHPDDKKILLERTVHLSEQSHRHSSEYRILPRGKASYRTIRDEVIVARDVNGTVAAIQGVFIDVTDEKALAEETFAMHGIDRSALLSIPEGILIVDSELRCIRWNEALARMTGRKAVEVLGQSPATVFPHMEQHRIARFLGQALTGEESQADDIRYYVPETNKIGYLWGRFSPIKDEHGTISGVAGLLTDFTDRKQLELEMRDSEQVLRNVIDTMGDILLIADLKGNVLEVNKSFLRVLGYSRSETIGHEFPYQWVLEEEMGRFVLWIAELRERNWLHDFDMTWRSKEGKLIPMSLSTTLLRNSMGEPIATLNIARDITERKRLTKDLESRTRQIEMINRIISKANETMDFDEIFHSIGAEINEVIASDLINIGILTEDEKSLTVYPLKGTQALHKGDTLPIENTLSRVAITSGKPVVVPDLSANEQYKSFSLFTKGLRSQIAFPIVLKGKAFGALNIGSREANFYSEDDAQILQPIAQQIGTIIDRVQSR